MNKAEVTQQISFDHLIGESIEQILIDSISGQIAFNLSNNKRITFQAKLTINEYQGIRPEIKANWKGGWGKMDKSNYLIPTFGHFCAKFESADSFPIINNHVRCVDCQKWFKDMDQAISHRKNDQVEITEYMNKETQKSYLGNSEEINQNQDV